MIILLNGVHLKGINPNPGLIEFAEPAQCTVHSAQCGRQSESFGKPSLWDQVMRYLGLQAKLSQKFQVTRNLGIQVWDRLFITHVPFIGPKHLLFYQPNLLGLQGQCQYHSYVTQIIQCYFTIFNAILPFYIQLLSAYLRTKGQLLFAILPCIFHKKIYHHFYLSCFKD